MDRERIQEMGAVYDDGHHRSRQMDSTAEFWVIAVGNIDSDEDDEIVLMTKEAGPVSEAPLEPDGDCTAVAKPLRERRASDKQREKDQ